MKRGKQVLAILLAVLCLVATLAGCGNKEEDAGKSQSSGEHKNSKALKRSDFALVDKDGTPVYISLYDHQTTGTKPGKDRKGFTTINNLTDITNWPELHDQENLSELEFGPKGMSWQWDELTLASHQWGVDHTNDFDGTRIPVRPGVFLKLRDGITFGSSQAAVEKAYGIGEKDEVASADYNEELNSYSVDNYPKTEEAYYLSLPYSQNALKGISQDYWDGSAPWNLDFTVTFLFDLSNKLCEVNVSMEGEEA